MKLTPMQQENLRAGNLSVSCVPASMLTDYSPVSLRPRKQGVYLTIDQYGQRWFNLFRGRAWHWGMASGAKAAKAAALKMSREQESQNIVWWRGLKEKPL